MSGLSLRIDRMPALCCGKRAMYVKAFTPGVAFIGSFRCHPAKALSDANIAIAFGTWTPGYALCGRTRLLLRTTRRSTLGSTDIVQSCRRSGDGLRASDRGLLARDVAHNLPRLGTLTMRLSMATPLRRHVRSPRPVGVSPRYS